MISIISMAISGLLLIFFVFSHIASQFRTNRRESGNDYKELSKRMEDNYKNLSKRMEDNYKDLSKRIEDNYKDLSKRMEDNYKDLSREIQRVYKELSDGINEIKVGMSEFKSNQTTILNDLNNIKESINRRESSQELMGMMEFRHHSMRLEQQGTSPEIIDTDSSNQNNKGTD